MGNTQELTLSRNRLLSIWWRWLWITLLGAVGIIMMMKIFSMVYTVTSLITGGSVEGVSARLEKSLLFNFLPVFLSLLFSIVPVYYLIKKPFRGFRLALVPVTAERAQQEATTKQQEATTERPDNTPCP